MTPKPYYILVNASWTDRVWMTREHFEAGSAAYRADNSYRDDIGDPQSADRYERDYDNGG